MPCAIVVLERWHCRTKGSCHVIALGVGLTSRGLNIFL